MKRYIISLIILMVLFLSASVLPQDTFEGKVKFKLISDDQTTDMTYYIKEGKIKVDVEGESQSSLIYDTQKQSMLVIMPEQKMYMDISVMPSEDSKTDEKKGEFKKTAEKKEILGYTAEKWIYKDDENDIESWQTKELGSFVFFSNPMDQNEKTEWQSKLDAEGYFPLLMIVKDSKGKVISNMEVTSVEKESLKEDMFTAPSEYQKISIPGM